LGPDLPHPAFKSLPIPSAIHDGRVVLVNTNGFGSTQVVQGDTFELDALFFTDHLAARQNGNVVEHGLAAVTKPRRLDRANLERAPQFVDHQRGKRFPFHIFSNDEERSAHFGNLLEDREQVLHVADLFLVDKDQRFVQDHFHLLRVGNEIRRNVAAVKLHPFNHFERRLHRLGFLDGDDPFLSNLVHGLCNDIADGRIVVGRDGADLSNFLLVLGRFTDLLQFIDHNLNGFLDTALEGHGIGAGCHQLRAFVINRLRQDRCRGGPVSCHITGLAGNFLDHLGAHVFEFVFELDFLGNRYTILGNRGTAKGFLDHYVASLRTQRYLHCICQSIDALQQCFPGFHIINQLLCRHEAFLPLIGNFPLACGDFTVTR